MNKKIFLFLVGIGFCAVNISQAQVLQSHGSIWAYMIKPNGACSVEGYLGNQRFTADGPSCLGAVQHLKNNCPNCTSTPTG